MPGKSSTNSSSIKLPEATELRAIRRKLLQWYRNNKRDLPWRDSRDPYAIWVSEIMLQQTRVDTVVPYYERFMERFPTLEALAESSQDELLSMWSGLGYYRRARLLHKGVRDVQARYGGKVPRDPDHRAALPGIGPYTAGAIGSIAFDQQEALVDGNVIRVLARLFALKAPVINAAYTKHIWRVAQELVTGPSPGDFNQALMELGALICTKHNPQCASCSVSAQCQAYQSDTVNALPPARKKTAVKQVHWIAVVAHTRSRVWMTKGEQALYGGLWGLPMCSGRGKVAAQRFAETLHADSQLELTRCGQVQHVLSHRALTVQVWRSSIAATARLQSPDGATMRLLSDRQLQEVGVSTLTRKLLDCASNES